MANWLGNLVDYAGTAVKAPELGISEFLGGGQSVYTGVTPQSKNAMFGGGYQYNPGGQAYSNANPNLNYNYKPQSVGQVQGASVGPSNSNSGGGGGGGGGGQSNYWSDSENKGFLNGQWYNDKNDWLRAGGQVGGPSQSDIQAQQNKVRDTINQGFNGIFSQLDSLAGLAPQYQAEDERFINDQYGVESQARQNELSANQAKLGTYRGDVANREKATLSSIAQDMRNMLKAGNSKIGAMGAADSSAVPMYNYALSKQTGQRTADVRNQSNSQYAELDRKEIDVKSAFDNAMTGLSSWKNEQLINAKERARQLLERVQNAKVGADQARLAALTNLETNILSDVTNNIRTIEAEERQNAKAIQNWATQRIASLQDYKINLQKSAAFDPRQLTYDALQGINYTGAPTDTTFYNPMAMQKKKADPWS